MDLAISIVVVHKEGANNCMATNTTNRTALNFSECKTCKQQSKDNWNTLQTWHED